MTRAAMLAALIVGIAMQPAAAEPFYREDLRIPMEAAGPRGLEAMLLRPSGTRRYPLALISHGTPREGRRARRCRRTDPIGKPSNSPGAALRHWCSCAEATAILAANMPRAAARATGANICGGMAVGQRSARGDRGHEQPDRCFDQWHDRGSAPAGGFASLALSADPPPGLAAAINFAGGRGSRADNDVCDEDALVRAFATLQDVADSDAVDLCAERQVLRA